jgi:antitoxin FitA
MYDPGMSKHVQIRDVPDDIHRTLRERAARAGISLSDYLRDELVRIARRPPIADVLRRAESRHGGVPSEAIEAAVREARERS